MESLEPRALLSVAGIGSETFKTFPFAASGSVVSDFTEGAYQIHVTGTVKLNGKMAYPNVNDGALAENIAAAHDAFLSGSGPFSAKKNGIYQGTGSWTLTGYSDIIVDQSGQLTGEAVVTKTTTSPNTGLSFNGTYTMENATFNTQNFALKMDLVKPDGTTMKFNGKMNPTGAAFDVIVTPTWNADGTIAVGVGVPGKPHTTATADRSVPVTNVQVYWAQGTALKSAALDAIPVYWNEASGSYTVSITDYPNAPAGATGLAFVTRFDGKTKIATLALPAVSIAAASVAEGDSSDPASRNHAVIPVTLGRPLEKDVTISYAAFKGLYDTAKPGINYVPTAGSIIIPAGETQGQIEVPILGNTTFEPKKTFSVKITSVENARVLMKQSQAVATITNDDPVPTISIDDVTLAEGTRQGTVGTTTRFVFTVALSNPSFRKITVNYATANGTATVADKDFQAKTGTLVINPGALTGKIVVLVNADVKVEEDETFFVNLSRPVYATIGRSQGLGTIVNDDEAPAQVAAASRAAALAQFAGPAELASFFDPFGRKETDEDAADAILAVG
jgi:hypothetical protein